jgi:hypothetical protein
MIDAIDLGTYSDHGRLLGASGPTWRISAAQISPKPIRGATMATSIAAVKSARTMSDLCRAMRRVDAADRQTYQLILRPELLAAARLDGLLGADYSRRILRRRYASPS